MSHPLRRLSRTALLGLAEALDAGRASAPFGRGALGAHVPDDQTESIQAALLELTADGMTGRHIARVLRLLAEERAAHQRMADRVELVLSPPELDRVDARDTVVVVRDLLHRAERTVLIASYALDSGAKAVALFGELGARMDADPHLEVQVHANVHREHKDPTPAPALVRAFAKRFREHVWPGERLPALFYDPRSVEMNDTKRAVLHAKCVVVDDRWSLLTSANFTEAAQERNIEAGMVLDDTRTAQRIRRQFAGLVDAGKLMRIPLP